MSYTLCGIRFTSITSAASIVVLSTLLAAAPSHAAGESEAVKATPMALIPAGTFLMGYPDMDDTVPVHEVYIDSFYIDVHEVTNAQYFEFCRQTDHALPEFWGMDVYRSGPDFPDHPVMGISWSDAKAYAEWLGKRLPTEAEWEYAARGGLVQKKFHTGDTLDSTVANYAKSDGPVPVKSYPPNGYGLYDMTGNVVEWCSDIYGFDYYGVSPDSNPKGPAQGKFRVIRGAGWHTGPGCCGVYFRNGLRLNWRDFNVGFRCVKDCNTASR